MRKCLLALFVVSVITIQGQEIVTLTVPIAKPNQTIIKLERVNIDVVSKTITIQWLGDNNESGTAVYSTPAPSSNPTQPTGASLLTTLNKINLSGVNPSLVARILARLQMDGYVPSGSISGTPE